jgi:pimeloyl-ACP methyl ester carboxylesterase
MKLTVPGLLLLAGTAHTAHAEAPIPEGFTSARMTSAEINLGYVRDGGDGETVILLHGWPQTWSSWSEVMPLLSAELDVIAVDLRGVGGSDKPEIGYDKKTMAADILALMDELGIERANIVGHDIGAMVAFAFAQQFPERSGSITLIDAPMPGTPAFEQIRVDPRAWHFGFHSAPEVPEQLIAGREEFYYGHFIQQMDAGMGAMGPEEIGHSVEAYSVPETTRAGLEWYRTMPQDAEDNAVFMETRLEVPVLALNAARLAPFPYLMESMQPLAVTVEGRTMESGHWIPETLPDELSAELLAFFQKY